MELAAIENLAAAAIKTAVARVARIIIRVKAAENLATKKPSAAERRAEA